MIYVYYYCELRSIFYLNIFSSIIHQQGIRIERIQNVTEITQALYQAFVEC
jgi:hypothetical protein